MSIIQNAIESIQIGIEDYQNADDRRSVSAIRNILAGILLLYKEKLCQLSPDEDKELLIKKNIKPVQNESGGIVFKGDGKTTVGVPSIKARFKDLKVLVDWKSFDEINKLRNDIEHYYTEKSPKSVCEIVAKSFLLIRDFLSDCLDKDPQETLGNDTWKILLEASEVYEAESKSCRASIDAIDWKYISVQDSSKHLRCVQCHSSLIQAPNNEDCYPRINLHCKSCDFNFFFGDVVEQCLAGEAYYAIKDGGESPYENCPECNHSTFIHSEELCILCGYKMEHICCEICAEPLNIEEQYYNGNWCSNCQYKWENMKEE